MQYRSSILCAAAMLAIACPLSTAQAATDSGAGRFFGATVIADGAWSLSFNESLADKTASLVISYTDAGDPASDTWSRMISLRDIWLAGPQYVGTNSVGDSVYAEVDFSRWTFTATGLLSTPPTDALFKTAYGQETLTAVSAIFGSGSKQVDQKPDFSGISISSSTPEGEPPMVMGEVATLPGLLFRFSHVGITPYYAKPSTTNPRCASLDCLDYEAGLYTPQRYVLTFALAEVAAPTSAVPEASTAWMALAGLGALAAFVRHRRT